MSYQTTIPKIEPIWALNHISKRLSHRATELRYLAVLEHEHGASVRALAMFSSFILFWIGGNAEAYFSRCPASQYA